ncbi:hypothetical protein GQ43DRAFT_445907 [Delitschia confertaspora ATCC 74209]|uniref:Uncharacterized protein n=1 Tax=Delitschia confertaspora ATCC 74209 TaxID=1513339 RepID=A0A9P4MX04_9PLEO|nr:hypothetical protein GQ43DRAFT_445907 [Delitschia confertaspora ATCC 74209]
MNTTSLINTWNDLKRALKLDKNHRFSALENKKVVEFINNQLPTLEKASTKVRPKPIANFAVAEDIITFLWRSDEYRYKHSRVRLQIIFVIIFFIFLGSRPGEVIESDAWEESNEGICYKDVSLVKLEYESYTGFVLFLRVRNRKNSSTTLILYEEPTKRYICPATHFILFALADGAIMECTTLADIQSRKPPPGTFAYKFQIKPETADIPILRATNRDGTISSSRILTASCFNSHIQGVGQRAGYEEPLAA